jgi:hypothetical protein
MLSSVARSRDRLVLALALAVPLAVSGCNRSAESPAVNPPRPAPAASPAPLESPVQAKPTPSPAAQPGSADAAALAEFEARVKDYVALQKKVEETLPKLSRDSTPNQIDSHQRALARLVREARAGARPGRLFTPGVQAVVHRLLDQVFGGADGAALKASIMDENPGSIKLTVNGRYPDSVPLSTVPPQVLQGLPELPDGLEFRFIGRHLILLDEHAHIIVDLMENALPR